jgi:hypothetical protein
LSSISGWPVDGHVHLHHRDLAGATLDAAAQNYASRYPRSRGLLGALLLAQSSRERVFEQLEREKSVGEWTLARADELESLIARRGALALAIVCGRQVRAQGGLEILALGTRREFADGRSLAETVADVRRSGALAVVPWGFGKWLGRRKQIVEAELGAAEPDALFLGDNGSRLTGRPPELIRRCEQRGFRVLPGTDPFPFGGDYQRVGSFGFLAEQTPREATPWQDLRSWLLARGASPTPFGRACGPLRFAVNQVGIQIHQRWLRGGSR